MKRISIIGLCLTAVMAISAMVASSASAALPEFKTAAFPVPFTSMSLPVLKPLLSATVGGAKVFIACELAHDKGQVEGPKELRKVVVLYLGCILEGTTKPCSTANQAAGKITTKEVRGLVGYLQKVPPIVGILFEPEDNKVFAEFTCAGTALGPIKVENAAIGEASPLNTESTMGLLLFEENAGKTGQLWKKLEGAVQECELVVSGGKAWFMDKELVEFSKAVELKA